MFRQYQARPREGDVYAFVFDQKGLMGRVGIQGSKITRISK
jgi:hypothetical protein